MAQQIGQGSIFGRIGSGIGKGLAEQIPKEVEQYRLASGLKKFEQDAGNLNPMQQLARLSSIPGITPQQIQSFSDLARQQNSMRALERRGAPADQGMPMDRQGMPNTRDVQFGNLGQQPGSQSQQAERPPVVARDETGVPRIANRNPLDERSLTQEPWTPEQRDSAVYGYLRQGHTLPDSEKLAADDEQRFLSTATARQKRDAELQAIQKKAYDELDRQLKLKLQKGVGAEGEEAMFKDISGEEKVRLQRSMERELRLNPESNIDDLANDFSNRAVALAKAKDRLKTEGERIGIRTWFKGQEPLKKLQEFSDIFKKAGNSEEYENILRNQYRMSKEGAASIAYPKSSRVDQFLNSYQPLRKQETLSAKTLRQIPQRSRRIAADIEDVITNDDSLLAIARDLSERDEFFDKNSFFDQLSEDKDRIGLTDRQRLELTERSGDVLTSWGDFLIFPAPIFRRK
jgi:hypothetical protein